MRFKDYYQVLGIERGATEEKVRQAYRRLARKYHPDLNPRDRTAEEKFKEINEANEVLSDPEKRKRYDQLGANWKDGVEFNPPPGWSGVNVEYQDLSSLFGGGGFSDFFESLFGGQRASRERDRRTRNNRKSSRSQSAEAEMEISLEDAHRGGRHRVTIEGLDACKTCGGTGASGGAVCSACRGTGQSPNPRTIDVNIPPGARDGSIIKLKGQGQPGDLLVKLRIRTHPVFTPSGDDITSEVPIAPWEAVLGATIEVPTLEGRAELKVPAGAQGGQRLRLRGQGLNKRGGGRGDAYVKLKIVVPSHASDQEKELYRQLADKSHFKPRSA